MRVVADRFVSTGAAEDATDLATGERVRLFVDAGMTRQEIVARAALCDRLAVLRHPLLATLVDYGADGRDWFEAYAIADRVRVQARRRRSAILHLVRFLRAGDVELTAAAATRAVVHLFTSGAASARPIGIFLRERVALEAMRTVLESDGPCGTTALDVVAAPGAGLRTYRLQVARAARLAGFVVIDAAASTITRVPNDRHLCVLDWLPRPCTLPRAIAGASVDGGRRHVWIRFWRDAPAGDPANGGRSPLRLEPMMKNDLTAAIFSDPELGPASADVRAAAEHADGQPGSVVAALSGVAEGGGTGWVHETSPQYRSAPIPEPPVAESDRHQPVDAGVARLCRAVAAAHAFASRGRHARAIRLLARGSTALADRGAYDAAASAACDLGELLLDRAQPERAAVAFTQARTWARESEVSVRALVGNGRALYDLDRLSEAEAVFRTAASASCGAAARAWLARTLWQRGELDAARTAVGDVAPALLARILLSMGQIDAAAAAVAAPAAAAESADDRTCDDHVARGHVYAAMRDVERVRGHMDAAMQAAHRARQTSLRFEVAAERWACLDRCGVPPPAKARDRLLRVASRLPPRAAAAMRAALRQQGPSDRAAAVAPDLVRYFQEMLDVTHDAEDEAAALQLIAASALRTLGACSVAIRSARPNQLVGAAGRSWPGEGALALPVLSGGMATRRDGITPEAVEPIGAAGAIVGSLAVRWVAGASPGWDRAREVLRATAVAAAPLVRAIRPVEPPAAVDAAFPDDLLGRGDASERVRAAIRRAASAPYPVLVEGESGSGKELVARAIHARGVRRARRFCAINCAALTDDLLEAELFGHARGAFTGAMTERAGLFEEADQGTLFLDEVGELASRAQAKLLRVLQEGEVRRVGENLSRKVDVRIVAATNRVLEREVEAGRFRADLRFRLDVIRIALPPLRERAEDIPWLVSRIWADATTRVGSRAVLGEDMLAALTRYDWPGNVRELQNVMASLAVHAPRRGRVPVALLPARIGQQADRAGVRYDEARAEFDRRFIRAALARAGGRRSLAAEQLGLSRQRLTKIMTRLSIE